MKLRGIVEIFREIINTTKGRTTEPQENWTEPIRRTIKEVGDSILQTYRTSQKQTEVDDKKSRRIATWAVIGAWVYACIAGFQYWEMRKSTNEARKAADAAASAARTAEDTLHLTEAADQDFLGVACEPQPLTTNSKVIPIFRNVGRSRADDVQVRFYVGTSHKPGPITTSPSRGIAGAGSTIMGEPRQIGITDLQPINDGTVKLFVYGNVTYRDIFGDAASLEFDATYVPKSVCDFRITKVTSQHERKQQQHGKAP